jgi:hypothetical protein
MKLLTAIWDGISTLIAVAFWSVICAGMLYVYWKAFEAVFLR